MRQLIGLLEHLRAGGHQEKVSVGDIITVNRMKAQAGDSVTLEPVLFVDGDARDRVAARDISKEPQLAPHVDVQTQLQRTEWQLHARLPGEEQQPGGAGARLAAKCLFPLPLLQMIWAASLIF